MGSRIEIIRHHGDLKREVWGFDLNIEVSSSCIYFDYYSFQIKESTRHRKWGAQTHWERLMSRNNNIDRPTIPPDVEAEMRSHYQEYIKSIPIRS